MLADEDVLFIDDLPPVIVPGDLCLSVVNQGVGGQDGLIVDELHIAPDPGFLGVAVICKGVTEKIKGVTDMNVNISIRENRVRGFIKVSTVAIHQGAVMAKDHVADDPLGIMYRYTPPAGMEITDPAKLAFV